MVNGRTLSASGLDGVFGGGPGGEKKRSNEVFDLLRLFDVFLRPCFQALSDDSFSAVVMASCQGVGRSQSSVMVFFLRLQVLATSTVNTIE
jgi:hypothetical protein